MRFTHPYYLLFLLIIPLGWYIARAAKVFFRPVQFYTYNILRSLVWILLILALAGMEIAWGRFGKVNLIWVLDNSDSISERQKLWFKEYLLRTTDALPSGSKASVVLCGRDANILIPLSEPEQVKDIFDKPLQNTPDATFTNLAAGVESALSLAPLGQVSRIVLLSDGNENLGRLAKTATLASSQGVPIYPILPPAKEVKEIVVEEFELPTGVQKGEPFEIKVRMNNLNMHNSKAVLKLLSDDKEIASDIKDLTPGLNMHSWVQTLGNVGPHFFQAQLTSEDDSDKQNNQILGAITVKGNPRLLCIEGKGGETQFLATVLENNRVELDVKTPNQLPNDMPTLASYDAVVFNNVPRKSITLEQMTMLKSYVSDLGGGFLMLGGEESFSSGGYYKTPLEEVLPVTMDQNVSYKFKQVLLILIIDRSPSMEGTKLELAKKSALKVMEQLRDSDMMGLFIFDSTHEKVFNFQMLWGQRENMAEAIKDIKVGKGGTNIYPALEDAYNLLLNPPGNLRQMPLQIKHILLLSDGKTYRGDDFEKLARKISQQGMSISTIALGQEAEVDLMSNIARLGMGLFHHPSQVDKLPELFVADLENAISKTPFVEKSFTPDVVVSSPILAGIDAKELPPLKGYMVTKPKPGANLVLASNARGFNDPVLMHWRYGLGTAVAYTSDVIPRWSTQWIAWKSFSKFWIQLTRFMIRQEKQDWEILVQRVPEGAIMDIDVGQDEDAQRKLSAYLVGTKGEKLEVALDRVSWGKYHGRVQTNLFGKFVLNIREDKAGQTSHVLTRGIVIPQYLGEYKQFDSNEKLLRQVAKLSNGEFNPQTNKTLIAPPAKTADYNPIWNYLVILAIVIFVVEVGLRKWWL